MRTYFKKIAVGVLLIVGLAQASFVYAQTTAPESQIDASSSRNWAGYIANGKNVTAVSGSWIVPTPDSTDPGSDATWIGIGGVASRDLIQTGTQAIVKNGSIQYSAWIERLPRTERKIPVHVSGGDSISASVAETSPGMWHISFKNNTNGESFETDVAYDSSHSSAEWIQELPTGIGFKINLDSFGTAQFTATSAMINGASVTATGADARAVRLVSRNITLAEPSALQSDGSFSVSRTSATSASVGNSYRVRNTGHGHRYRIYFFRS